MARQIFRAFPVYANGKKVAEIRQGTYDVTNNDEAQVAIDGYQGHTDGATMSSVQATLIIPVTGTQIDFDSMRKTRQYVQIGMPVNGKFQMMDMRLVKAQYKWDSKNGQAEGDFTFEGGEPDFA